MLVVRAEDGMLGDLEGVFRDVFWDQIRPNCTLPQGRVILVGSLSHMTLLGITTHVEDMVKLSNSLISLTGPGVSICPLVSIPLSGVSDGTSIAAMANMDSWVVSNKMGPNISLPETRNKLPCHSPICASAGLRLAP